MRNNVETNSTYRILKFDIVRLDCSKSKKKRRAIIIKRKGKKGEKQKKDAKLRVKSVCSEIKTDSLCTSLTSRVRFEQVTYFFFINRYDAINQHSALKRKNLVLLNNSTNNRK